MDFVNGPFNNMFRYTETTSVVQVQSYKLVPPRLFIYLFFIFEQ